MLFLSHLHSDECSSGFLTINMTLCHRLKAEEISDCHSDDQLLGNINVRLMSSTLSLINLNVLT
jgi:hypothetical protein